MVPIVIDGFRTAFDKKGLFIKKRNTELSVRIKPALQLDYSQPNDGVLSEIMDAIEQSDRFNPAKNKLNKA